VIKSIPDLILSRGMRVNSKNQIENIQKRGGIYYQNDREIHRADPETAIALSGENRVIGKKRKSICQHACPAL